MMHDQPLRPVKIRVENVSKVFGRDPAGALAKVRAGMDKTRLKEETDHVLGLHDARGRRHRLAQAEEPGQNPAQPVEPAQPGRPVAEHGRDEPAQVGPAAHPVDIDMIGHGHGRGHARDAPQRRKRLAFAGHAATRP